MGVPFQSIEELAVKSSGDYFTCVLHFLSYISKSNAYCSE